MSKSLYIAEKPSVAREFAKALKVPASRNDGYLESENAIVTWCVGHLVTMSYPESYDPALKRWSLDALPFIPEQFKYEIIPQVKEQFQIVKGLLNRSDVDTIYVCTDSGREGEYIYRLVEDMAGVKGKQRKRVWIDSQTEEEILRGVREAKDLSEYDNLASSAYLRAKEDYLMGINFSRLLTLKYGKNIANYLQTDRAVLSVGRVMTCVLGMVVRREREIREFIKTPFYRVLADLKIADGSLSAEFRAVEGTKYYGTPYLYKENGFKERKTANELIAYLSEISPVTATVLECIKKQEKKNPPLLYNLAELQNDCSKILKISPDETLKVVQELYEKKLVTYPRTDARVLSSAIAKEINKNISGLKNFENFGQIASDILESGSYKKIGSSKYTNDKQITDHYAIIPTGQGFNSFDNLSSRSKTVYRFIVRRFLSIFLPPAVYRKISLTAEIRGEQFFANYKVLEEEGYLKLYRSSDESSAESSEDDSTVSGNLTPMDFANIKKGTILPVNELSVKEGETSPPKRYNSGSMILAMENAGQLIEDEELRSQIKGSGIGTSATRAEILKKLVRNRYLSLNNKTQILSPTQLGEMVFDTVNASIRSLLNPELTASWEKGLTYMAEGSITEEEYMSKLKTFIISRTHNVMNTNNSDYLRSCFDAVAPFYKKTYTSKKASAKETTAKEN